LVLAWPACTLMPAPTPSRSLPPSTAPVRPRPPCPRQLPDPVRFGVPVIGFRHGAIRHAISPPAP
jgi:hypothetical protein